MVHIIYNKLCIEGLKQMKETIVKLFIFHKIFFNFWNLLVYTAVVCGQGTQVMLCMTNELLRDDLYFFLNKEHHGFGTKLEKSEADLR